MIKKILLTFLTLLISSVILVRPVFAQKTGSSQVEPSGIRNPVIGNFGGNKTSGIGSITEAQTGGTFLRIFILSWRSAIFLGSILVIVMFLWGGISWITAGGDKGKVEKARDRMTQAVIGLVVLVSSFVIIGFLGTLIFGEAFDILKLTIPTPG